MPKPHPVQIMKLKRLTNSRLAALGLALALTSNVRADYNPIPLTGSSFNADVVVEKTAAKPFNDYTSATMDGGTNNNAWAWFEQGYLPSVPTSGLPPQGSTLTAIDGSGRTFIMPPDYTANNVLCVYTNLPQGTLTPANPAAGVTLSVLFSGGGASTITFTVHYAGGGTQSGALTVSDWFNTSAQGIAHYAGGRVNMDSGVLGNLTSATTGGTPRLFYQDITLSDSVNPVVSIDFSSPTNNNRAAIFGLSISADGTTFTPVPVSGFNRDMVVEASAPHNGSYQNLTTVTMDNGTFNFGNTWYEKGFNRGNTGSGVPNANTTFSVGNHTYRMAPSYTENNVLFLSPTANLGTLNLAAPATLSSLSVVSSAGNGPVTLSYTVYHADSSTESGSFSSLDWFNTSATAAFTANGRFQVETLAYNNMNASPQVPRAFFNDLPVSSASPVTRIEFSYSSAGGRAMIFALSGSSDGTTFSPLAVTGYNADGIVEASAPARPNPLYNVTSASMD